MKKILTLCIVLLFSSCSSDNEIYKDQDRRFRQLNAIPEVFVIVKREADVYYKIIHFTSDWEFLNGINEGNVVHEGYYISDGDGFNGYDLKRQHSTLSEAINAAQSAGKVYEHQLGKEYNYQSGSFYRNSPFVKLNKQ